MAKVSVNNGIYFIILAALYIISPTICLLVALAQHRNAVSQFFMVAFSFYFGFQVGPILDLNNHYSNYLYIFGLKYSEMLDDSHVLFYGKEPYHMLFKYILAQFNASARVFAGVACVIYTALFILFVRQLRPIIKKRLTMLQLLVLLLVVVVVDFYWYLGLRFWTGVFFIMIFFTKYLVTEKPIYLLPLLLGSFIHYVLLSVSLILIAAPLLKNRRVVLVVSALVSYVFRFVDFGFFKIMSGVSYIDEATDGMFQNELALKELRFQNDYFRERGNFIYQHRTDFIFFSVIFILLLMMFKNKSLTKQFGTLFAATCLMLIAANFGYSEYVLFTRLYKMVGLLISMYLFFQVMDVKNNFINHSVLIRMFLFFLVTLSLLISVVQLRASIVSPELWFGNFFVEAPIVEYSRN